MSNGGFSAPPSFLTPKRKGLGRGLASLFEGQEEEKGPQTSEGADLQYLSPDLLLLGKYQPRHHFSDEELQELAQSIREKGVLQPILVRRHEDRFELIAGERRLRASRIAGLAQIPCRVLEVSSHEAFEIALLENIQRTDLSPLEEAHAYRQLLDSFEYTQEDLSQRLGKSRAHIANMLRLLTLPSQVQDLLEKGKLSAGHARTLITTDEPLKVALEIIDRGLTVREAEQLARHQKDPSQKSKSAFAEVGGAEEVALSQHLVDLTGLPVKIQIKPSGGVIQINFKTPMELDSFLEKMTRGFLDPTSRVLPS
ncbi:MAG: ParB/RepB/Spo0J family partition protein [Holosporales bacterium]|nr:ParB/RepB/Spo0J family partition protein [Holosporales bacterium]